MGTVCEDERASSSGDLSEESSAVERELELAARQALESQLRQARSALHRALQSHGDFCEACGTRIEQARLEAVPETTMCIECQRTRERHRL